MKKTLLTLTLIFGFSLIGKSQIITIPDNNLKNKLLSASTTNLVAKNAMSQWVKIDTNSNGEIEVSEALLIYQLFVNSSNISDATGLESFTNLRNLNCSNNSLTSINTNTLTYLSTLNCSSNQITLLSLTNNANLGTLNCSSNSITTLNLSNKPYLGQVNCDFNQLLTLDTTQNPQLFSLECDNNQLENLYINNSELWFLSCDFNQLTTLDVSQSQITNLTCSNNNLEVLIIKNNIDFNWQNLAIGFNPNLYYVCCDEADIEYVEQIINDNNYNSHVNTYCLYNPGGIYNTIIGKVFYDFGNDGCDVTDITRFSKVVINDGTENGASFTNQSGQYRFFTQAGNFTLSTEIENPSFFNVTPAQSTVTFPLVDESEEVVNFCVTPNGVHPDLEVVIAPIFPARPGFQATYKIVYRNKGNQVLSQQYGVNFFYNQQLMTFMSATVTPETQAPGGMNWSYENLMPFEERNIEVTMLINAPTDLTNPVNIGDVLTFTSVISPQANDANVIDNTFIFNQTVVGAYDPNDITCIEGENVSATLIGDELHYIIRFENTGNFYAENVVVAMDINPDEYDISSLKVLSSSHNVDARVKSNKVEFFFNGIFLDTGGHGNVLLVMKSNSALSEGDSVMSKADIYFDYNYPIITNEAETVFQALSNPDFEIDKSVKIYPNPTSSIVNISGDFNIKSIQLFDVQGRLLQTSLSNDTNTILDLTQKAKGMYFIKVISEAGIKVEKIIKK